MMALALHSNIVPLYHHFLQLNQVLLYVDKKNNVLYSSGAFQVLSVASEKWMTRGNSPPILNHLMYVIL